jgi:hypothetical protein
MTAVVDVAPYSPDDREALLALVPRLCVGVARWRSREGVRAAARAWIEESIGASSDA